MRIIEKTVYNFSELSESTKEQAIQKFYSDGDFAWIDEIRDSFKAARDLLQIRITNNGNYRDNGLNGDINLMTGLRLRKWLINNILPKIETPKIYWSKNYQKKRYSKITFEVSCPFTGCCYDDDFLDPILDFIKYEQYYRDNDGRICLDSLCNEIVRLFDKLVESEQESQQTEECFNDLCEANDYEFDENGNLI